jgi:hypothetical protein
MKKKFDLFDGLVLLAFIGLIILHRYLFRHFWDLDYLGWYLHNGAQISWLVALMTLIWGDLNKNAMMISPRPLEYLVGYSLLLGVLFNSLAPIGRTQVVDQGPVTSYRAVDQIISTIVLIAFTILLFAWTVVIVPVQYFVFFLCGAPGRLMMYAKERPIVRLGFPYKVELIGSDKETPSGWWETSLAQKPVAITAAFAGMFLWLLQIAI